MLLPDVDAFHVIIHINALIVFKTPEFLERIYGVEFSEDFRT